MQFVDYRRLAAKRVLAALEAMHRDPVAIDQKLGVVPLDWHRRAMPFEFAVLYLVKRQPLVQVAGQPTIYFYGVSDFE